MKLKPRSVAKVTMLAIALGTTATISQPSQAQISGNSNPRFLCGTFEGSPTTMVRSRQLGQDVPLIRWDSPYFQKNGYTPRRRCQEVSNRFQAQYQNGNLRYMTTGRMGGQPTICVANERGGSCAELLFTLRPSDRPNEILRNLFTIQRWGGSAPINQSTYMTFVLGERELQTYIDVYSFLRVVDGMDR